MLYVYIVFICVRIHSISKYEEEMCSGQKLKFCLFFKFFRLHTVFGTVLFYAIINLCSHRIDLMALKDFSAYFIK